MSLTPGQRLGPYEILSAIGAGGMGEVYRAKDTRLDREVAVKVLPASVADDAERLARFEREAKAVAALSHPNILSIFDFGAERDANGPGHVVAYAVTELLDGETLRQRLDGGALTVRKTVEYAVQIARGLAAAHDKGLVHRDIKPENIFLLRDGQVKILDFGLARQAVASSGSGASQTMAAVTDPGTVLGTVGYMAPEMVRGQPVDARSDLFAFGAVLYEMLSGRRAFQHDTAAETMTAIMKQDPPELTGSRAEISPALDRIVRHCLEKNPAERFQSARDVAFALEALSGSNVSGPSVPVDTDRPLVGRRPAVVTAVVVLAALALGWIAGAMSGRFSEAPAASVAEVTYQPVTFDEGFVFAARFAPDGRTIVYSADWDEQARDIFVTSVDGPESRGLNMTGADLVALSLSGDLAILENSAIPYGNPYVRTGTLARASLTGGAPKPELENVVFADFAPEGAMAVVRLTSGRFSLEYPIGEVIDEQPGLYTPRVSPTGSHVAVFSSTTGPGLMGGDRISVKIFERAGDLVAESTPFADWWSLAWTPAGEVWFAAAEVAGRQTALFSLDLSGNQRRVFNAPGAITVHDISARGELLVSFDSPTRRLEILDGRSADLPRDLSWKEGADPEGLSDGHVVLFSQTGDSGGPGGAVYVWKPGAPVPVNISEGTGLALSPDGGTALVRTSQGLSLIPTGVGQPRTLDISRPESIEWAGWLPDGRILFEAGGSAGTTDVSAVAPTGGTPTAALPEGFRVAGQNLISPDGARIAAFDVEDRLVTCVLATEACELVPGIGAGEEVAGWSADNRSLFVFERTKVPTDITLLDVATGRRRLWRTLRPLQAAVSGMGDVFAAPDGTLVYSYGRSRTQLYVIRGLK